MILVAPDKFKGTFTAQEICEIVERRLRVSGIDEEILGCPMSDGGEGIAENYMPGSKRIAPGIYEKDGSRLVVSSEIVGFSAFSGKNIPLIERTSYALGKAVIPGVPTVIAVGGTATSDGGAGFLQGLGVKFYDEKHREIEEHLSPVSLRRVCSADLSVLEHFDISGIIDVRAGLTDGSLSALDFARQKALQGENPDILKDALAHFQEIMGGRSEWDGAGGGLGYAIATIIGANCMSGGEAAVRNLKVNWEDVKLIITGEGKVDKQTVLGGKLVDAVYREGVRRNIPTIILYGACEPDLPYPHMAQLESNWEQTVEEIL